MNALAVFVALAALSAPVYSELHSTRPSPAEEDVSAATLAIEADAEDVRGHVALAFAHAKRARETADPAHYERAAAAVERALELDPKSFHALKAKTWVLLGQHEFPAALKLARELNRQAPDDLQVYGFLVDAYVELGDYDAAEQAAQWMLDLRPANVAGLTRAAYLRELFGDVEGAIDLFEMAYVQVPGHELEDRAWILTHVAHLRLAAGDLDRAERLCYEATSLFPDYHYALAQLAQVRTAQGRHAEAAELYRKRYELAPHPENLYDVACALERAGDAERAAELYPVFEAAAREESAAWDNANRELIRYWAEAALRGEARAADEAVALARAERERRGDVHTLDVLAWALFAAERHDEAREAIEGALAVGVHDAGMSFRAGRIALAQGDREGARRHFEESLRRNPRSEVAADAKRELAGLGA